MRSSSSLSVLSELSQNTDRTAGLQGWVGGKFSPFAELLITDKHEHPLQIEDKRFQPRFCCGRNGLILHRTLQQNILDLVQLHGVSRTHKNNPTAQIINKLLTKPSFQKQEKKNLRNKSSLSNLRHMLYPCVYGWTVQNTPVLEDPVPKYTCCEHQHTCWILHKHS